MSNNKDDKSTEVVNLLESLINKVDALSNNVGILSAEKVKEVFYQEVLLRLKELEKDLRVFRRRMQIDILSFAKDLTLFEERLEKIESKLELEADFQTFRQEVLSRLDELSDQKHYVDFLTLKSARMQLELNKIKAEVAALQQR
ncbi:MAG: hypothetical protein WAQ98_17735 [Blastocatellia bacterium]